VPNSHGVLVYQGELVEAVHDPQRDTNHCAMTWQRMPKPGMTADGFVYQMGYIMNWLTDHGISPLTGLELEHCNILRMSSVKDIIGHFLSACRDQRGAQRECQEERAKAWCQTEEPLHSLMDHLRELYAYVETCEAEIEGWQRHVDKMQFMAGELRLNLQQ